MKETKYQFPGPFVLWKSIEMLKWKLFGIQGIPCKNELEISLNSASKVSQFSSLESLFAYILLISTEHSSIWLLGPRTSQITCICTSHWSLKCLGWTGEWLYKAEPRSWGKSNSLSTVNNSSPTILPWNPLC